jgi:hypothetical protein
LRPFVLAASLAFLAAPAGAQTPPPEVPEALFDQFLAALPHQEEWGVRTDPDPTELATLSALNPGHEAEVRALLTDQARCFGPIANGAARRGLRTIAGRLGPDKVRQLIALYGSAEFRRFDSIVVAKARGETVSPADEREADRFLPDHPVAAEFVQALKNAGSILASDEAFVRGATGCAEAAAAAFEKAKLRRN